MSLFQDHSQARRVVSEPTLFEVWEHGHCYIRVWRNADSVFTVYRWPTDDWGSLPEIEKQSYNEWIEKYSITDCPLVAHGRPNA
jgi:hypothetical protein